MENNFCFFCMNRKSEDICPVCGSGAVRNAVGQLRCGELLNSGKYTVGRCLGQGGFGITYIGRDLLLDRLVAVKEFFPSSMVGRDADDLRTLRISEGEDEAVFASLRDKFIIEARALAGFSDDPNIVNVLDFFSENNTVYIVMEYLPGKSLAALISENGRMTEQETLSVMLPLIDTLDRMHKRGLLHRDLSPSNIIISGDKVKLLDFGSARTYTDPGKDLTVISKQGYSPAEQYSEAASEQGAWSDVYSLAATAYKAVTGAALPPAFSRLTNDTLKRPSELGVRLSKSFENALMHALTPDRRFRTQSMPEFRAELTAPAQSPDGDDERTVLGSGTSAPVNTAHEIPHVEQPADKPVKKPKRVKAEKGGKKKKPIKRIIITSAAVLTALFAAFVWIFSYSNTGFHGQTISMGTALRLSLRPTATSLYFSDCEISEGALKTIANNPAIRSMVFENCTGFSDLSMLSKMKNLRYLTYEGTEDDPLVITTQFKREFPNIQDLTFNYAMIADPAVLTLFPNVQYLNISMCAGVSNTDFISSLPKLYSMTLSYTDLSECDLSGLASAKTLSVITAEHCNISDISPIEGCASLRNAQLSYNSISNTDFLRQLPKLSHLNLSHNPLSGTPDISACTELESLNVSGTGISDLDFCENALYLHNLYASDNNLSELSGLSNCSVLRKVDLGGNSISDASVLAKSLGTLTVLGLGKNGISDISWLSGSTGLLGLDICENNISDISAIAGNTGLRALSAYGNQIEDVSALENMPTMRVLDLGENRISDISPLRQLTKLEILVLQNNNVSDISPVSGATMEYLFVHNNPVKVETTFDSLAAYSAVWVDYNGTPDVSALQKQNFYLHLIDTPLDEQAKLTEAAKKLYYYNLQFNTAQEATDIVAEKREAILAYVRDI